LGPARPSGGTASNVARWFDPPKRPPAPFSIPRFGASIARAVPPRGPLFGPEAHRNRGDGTMVDHHCPSLEPRNPARPLFWFCPPPPPRFPANSQRSFARARACHADRTAGVRYRPSSMPALPVPVRSHAAELEGPGQRRYSRPARRGSCFAVASFRGGPIERAPPLHLRRSKVPPPRESAPLERRPGDAWLSGKWSGPPRPGAIAWEAATFRRSPSA